MLTAVGEEYLCYSESNTGQYSPLVAIARYDGTLGFRDLVKDDLTRIADAEIFPGGWLFRKTMSSTGSWIKRFTILRGNYLFLFHNPQNEKPIGVIPLEGCKVVAPENDEKTFDEQRSFRANDGYEFDIRHNSRPTVRLYALSALERVEWLNAVRGRLSVNSSTVNSVADLSKLLPQNSNIVITAAKLSGVSLAPSQPTQANQNPNHLNPFLPPPPPKYSDYDAGDVESILQGTIGTLNSPEPSHHNDFGSSSELNTVAESKLTSSHYGGIPPPPPGPPPGMPLSATPEWKAALGSLATPPRQRPSQFSPLTQENTPIMPKENKFAVNKIKRSIIESKFSNLESNLSKIVQDQKEARIREDAFRNKISSKEALNDARKLEEQNPLTFSEIFRLMLFFCGEEVAEDPHPDSKQQCPYVKGKEIEEMLLTVYRRYCGETGFMSIEQFVEFMDDCAILQTHAEHNDNDEPLDEYKDLLDPVHLIRSLPKNIQAMARFDENGLSTQAAITDQRHLQAQKIDKFVINFGQFYQLLVHMTQIVYPELYQQDSTVAFNKILLEVICPFYLWCKGHHKRGSIDPLVLEERIPLVMMTYAPNLWKLFLNYATDAVGKIPEINSPFPVAAQLNERGLFKLSSVTPQKFRSEGEYGKANPDSLIMTETAFLRFARDYGLMPFVCSQTQIKEFYQAANRRKVIISSRLPTREQLDFRPHSTAQIDKASRQKEAVLPMHLGNRHDSHWIKTRKSESTSPIKNAQSIQTGLNGIGFSEFVEMIGRIAVEGLLQPNYHIIFPTPFSKVLAVLTVWGVADMAKLEEVRVIRTDENY